MSPALDLTTRNTRVELRRHRRFPITANAECLLDGRRSEVVTTDISSAGILVQSADILPTSARVELRIDWPSRLDGRCPLRLVVVGKVFRTTARGTVISIALYEYRLAPTAPMDLEKRSRFRPSVLDLRIPITARADE
jgi:hypothetical protein